MLIYVDSIYLKKSECFIFKTSLIVNVHQLFWTYIKQRQLATEHFSVFKGYAISPSILGAILMAPSCDENFILCSFHIMPFDHYGYIMCALNVSTNSERCN